MADEQTSVGKRRFAREAEPITPDFAFEMCEAWREGFNEHNADACVALVTHDVLFDDSAFYGGVARGREEVRAALESAFRALPDAQLDEPDVFLSLDRCRTAVSWRLTGTLLGPLDPPGFAPTNQRIEVVGSEVFEYRSGQICAATVRWDMADVARQIGAAPALGSRGERLAVRLQRLTARRLRKEAGA